jgi:hypothetical protein
MATFLKQTIEAAECMIGSHIERDAIEYGGTNVQYPGVLIGKRTSDSKAMICRLGTVASLSSKTITLVEDGMAKNFQAGETLTLRKKVTRKLPDMNNGGALTGITEADPGIITSNGHGLTTGDKVYLDGIFGMVELNGTVVTVTVVDDDEFSIGVDTLSYTTYTAGGAFYPMVDDIGWVDIALGECASKSDDDNEITYDGSPSSSPSQGDYVLVKDGSEAPIGILHSFVNPDDTTLNTSVRYVYHGKANVNLIRNWHSSFADASGLSMILFVDREVN